MVGVNRGEGRVRLGVKVIYLRRRNAAGSDREQLFAEDAPGAHLTEAVVVGVEIRLVPGDPEGLLGCWANKIGRLYPVSSSSRSNQVQRRKSLV
jgi:hypothetical protein